MPLRAPSAPSFGSHSGADRTPRAGSEAAGKERSAPFVSVAVRVKPCPPEQDIAVWPKPAEGSESCRRVCCHRGYLLEEYEFSRVFSPEDDNRRLFEGLQGPTITDSVFSGVSETLFAYGQTGSGKTHTIFGSGSEPGLLQYFVREVFDRAAESIGSTVHVCCYEVLGDTLTDLIKPEALVRAGTLRREDVVCDELFLKTQKFQYKIVQVDSKATCTRLLQEARVNRTSGISSCNSSSSRSHAICHIFVQNPALEDDDAGVNSSSIGALTLVDLAGAEKEHDNPSVEGRKCARLLNTSLSSLNRLLRKLQTNSLDESERRQSVLNKCLWEYLRPGCGIALIFCVSPLYRHRTTSFSTLSMATASKLIHSRRKSQYIQVPAGSLQSGYGLQPAVLAATQPLAASPCAGSPRTPAHGGAPDTTPRARRGASADAARQRGRTPDNMSTPRRTTTPANASAAARGSTPRRTNSTPAGARGCNSAASARGRASLTASTPRGNLVPSSPFCLPAAALEDTGKSAELEMENSKLRRKLTKARTQSRDRLVSVEQAHLNLSSENAQLRQECESLRSLFIRQQQQQIAFWAGPFMETILGKKDQQVASDDIVSSKLGQGNVASMPGGVPGLAAALNADQDKAKAPLAQEALLKSYLDAAVPWKMNGISAGIPMDTPDAKADNSECVQSLLQDRDYWQSMASQLKSEMHRGAPLVHLSLEKGTIGTRSTSHQSSASSVVSECEGNAEMMTWSEDSGTETTRSTAEN